MKVVLLEGSPHKDGNTAALLTPFREELRAGGAESREFFLYDLRIQPCRGCRACQRDTGVFGCPEPDDVQTIFDALLECQLLVLATPIYSWYCTPPMKALLDRLVYGMNKFYGPAGKGPSLWAGRRMALLLSCGYPPEKGADLFIQGMRRYCRHSGLVFAGSHTERHLGYGTVFMDAEKEARTRAFARELLNAN
jgi:multimeric flavodoxin WrbA